MAQQICPDENCREAEPVPNLGLVCLTHSNQCRYRTITRTRYLSLEPRCRAEALHELYWDNLNRLRWALFFCARRRIRLYRVTSNLFPMSDEPAGRRVLQSMGALLYSVGRLARRLDVRVMIHPDQFVVLNSVSPKVVRASLAILARHALAFDLMGLPRSPWAMILLHGGKSGRADELTQAIRALPPSARRRLALENDERAYSASQIHEICRAAGVPMVFDCHHHVVKEKLDSYEHPSIAEMTRAARTTWPDPDWQVVHLSNGLDSFGDPRHSFLIRQFPSAFAHIPWIEVEAKGKELAIEQLRQQWPALSATCQPVSSAVPRSR